jgi:hypothetical protein
MLVSFFILQTENTERLVLKDWQLPHWFSSSSNNSNFISFPSNAGGT